MEHSAHPPGFQVDGPLAVREEEDGFLVVREDAPEDWLVRFEKSPDFPARAWAENMVNVYNRRLNESAAAGTPMPTDQHASSYHPEL